MISLIQHFEADFLWKVSLKILNSGIILKKYRKIYQIVHCYHYDWPMNILEIPYWKKHKHSVKMSDDNYCFFPETNRCHGQGVVYMSCITAKEALKTYKVILLYPLFSLEKKGISISYQSRCIVCLSILTNDPCWVL